MELPGNMARVLNGQEPQEVLDAKKTRTDVMIGVSVGMTFIGVLCVALRVYTRAFIVRKMGPEDWTMVFATFLAVVYLLEIIEGVMELNLGFGAASMSSEQMISTTKLIISMIVEYNMIVTVIKISILMVYLRLAFNKSFEYLCKGTIGVLATFQAAFLIVILLQCIPLRKLWDFTGSVEGQCINMNIFYHVSSVFHILMDIWILVLPIRLIKRIPRRPREKFALYVNIALGVISMIASIVRLIFLHIFTLSNDPFYDAVPIIIWSMVEVNVGVLCATIPIMKPLLYRARDIKSRTGTVFTTRPGSKTAPVIQPSDDKILFAKQGEIVITHMTPPVPPKRETKAQGVQFEVYIKPPPVPPKDDYYTSPRNTAVRQSESGYLNHYANDNWI